MLIARLFAPITKRLAHLLTVSALIVAVVPFGVNRTVKACPEVPPQPLRTLYTQSDRIVVARAGESWVVQVDVQELYKSTLVCTNLYVSSTLKGEGDEPLIQVYHVIWGDDQEIAGPYVEGERMLLFLERRAEGHGYEVNDTTYGIKKPSDDGLKIYTKRIEELAEIMRQEKPDKAQIVEWLIRCAEEEETRWDGLLDLYASYEAMIAIKEQQEKEKESSSENAGETVAASVDANASDETVQEGVIVFYGRSYRPDPELARLLTDEQKTRLGTILFSAQTITYDEYRLMRMVRDWNDPRLVPFLLSQLRKASDDTSYVQDMIDIVVKALDNEAVTTLAERYSGNIEDEDSEQSAADESASDEDDESSVGEARRAAEAAKREEKLQKFIALAESSLIN